MNVSLDRLKGLGVKRLEAFQSIGICTVYDLVSCVPFKYLDKTKVVRIQDVTVGDYAVVRGEIIYVKTDPRSQRFTCRIEDESGVMDLVFFNGMRVWQNKLKVGVDLVACGTVNYYGNIQMAHPELEVVSKENTYLGKIEPVYSISEVLKKARVDQKLFRKLIAQGLAYRGLSIVKVPEIFERKLDLVTSQDLLKKIHFPESMEAMFYARNQLKKSEILPVVYRIIRNRRNAENYGEPRVNGSSYAENIRKELPFQLTEAQNKAIAEVTEKMKERSQFQGVLQADVGAGKTVVALLTTLNALEAGFQVALLAPTEILAIQQYKFFKKYLNTLNIQVELLTGSVPAKEKRLIKDSTKLGLIRCLIGTHALMVDDVEFQNLGFVVIDEQHRFGVAQRQKLIDKGNFPDVLLLTATPIPRTLMLSYFGDVTSIIMDQKPENRIPVKTRWVGSRKRADMLKFMDSKIKAGEQVFWVLPKIEENDEDFNNIKSLEQVFEELSALTYGWKIARVHGKLDEYEKNQIVSDFREGLYDLIVATTVIEVGVDIPNSSIIVIENAERFGLAQLHQLRGRVGRSSLESWCFIMTGDDQNTERINIFCKESDGFKIAEHDLEERGAGNLEGMVQSGGNGFRFFDFLKDYKLINELIEKVEELLENVGDFNGSDLEILDEWAFQSEKHFYTS